MLGAFLPRAKSSRPAMSRSALILVALCWLASTLRAEVDYQSDIKPLLEEKCGACHSVLKQEAGLRLDAGALIRQGGDDGSVLDPNDVAASRLIQRVVTTELDERMPPDGEGTPLTIVQVQQLIEWIQLGAPSPADEPIIEVPSQHWAYQPPLKSGELALHNESEVGNPIDVLLRAKWREQRLVPNAAADNAARVRRAYLDVTGLPPTLDQQDSFLAEPSSVAWDELVDRLLDDPAYGERWGRHWMDIWRYSDWDGYKNEVRGSQRHIWHWRDWIVESLNADKGYDRMTREMLAADEIAPDDMNALRATGFLVRNYHISNRDIWLDATVEHTAKAFLGMTIACARCHDHKYDPISQRDYYSMRAIFEPHRARTERLPGQADLAKQGLPRAYDADLDAATYLYHRGNEKNPDKEHPIAPNVPEFVSAPFTIVPVTLTQQAAHPYLKSYIEAEELASAESQLASARDALAKQTDAPTAEARQGVTVAETRLESLKLRWAATKETLNHDESAKQLALSAAAAERSFKYQQSLLSVVQKQSLLEQAKASSEADEAKKKAAIKAAEKALATSQQELVDASVATLETNDQFAPVGTSYPVTSSGRRKAFADWITHPDNPLTARVAINHIWLRYFGEPLVENVFDFGLRSPRPRHLELLDFLAVELMEHNWGMKHIHRLILTSHAYRKSSDVNDLAEADRIKNERIDPDNHWFWRANVRRLDAEAVRDSLLAVGGLLDRTIGGEELDFNAGETTPRRSLYYRHAYEKQMTMLVVFDAANPTDCYRRSESVIPQQALALANSPLARDQSRRLAKRLSAEVVDDSAFINLAYRVTLGRSAGDDESSACASFLRQQTELLASTSNLVKSDGAAKTLTPASDDPAQRARESLVHVLLNHNDFITLR